MPSKSDYWQRRTVSTDVALREDGSARVRMEVEVHNDSPPYVQPVPDPRQGYFTRWNTLSVAPFLPTGATFDSVEVDGEPVETSPSQLLRPLLHPPRDRVRAAGPPHPRA